MEANQSQQPWNKGKLVGQKPPLKPKDIWAIRIGMGRKGELRPKHCLFPSRLAKSPHVSTRQYARTCINGLPPLASIRRSMERTPCGGPRQH